MQSHIAGTTAEIHETINYKFTHGYCFITLALGALTSRYRQRKKTFVYSVTPKPDRRIFENNEKVNKKYQLLMVRFIKVIHPSRYGEI